MKLQILNLISLYHELDLAPTSQEIFRLTDSKMDFVRFNALLAQMVQDGELMYEDNKYALPDSRSLIEITWNREFEIQYFINQFRAISQILKLLRFVKSVGVCRNSFYNNSNEVYLNIIVEKGTVFSAYYSINKLLKFFDKFSIFDTKIQVIMEQNTSITIDDHLYFFIRDTYPVFGTYEVEYLSDSKGIFVKSDKSRSWIGTLLSNLIDPILKRQFKRDTRSRDRKYLFCNIQKYVDKIIAHKKVNQLVNSL